jgi:uncharacterized membrane protein
MKSTINKQLESLLQSEQQQLQKLNELVLKSIEEEKLITEKLYEFEDRNPPLSSRIADAVATFGGSWWFILSFFAFILIWVLLNIFILTRPFDGYPFILLNLILSCIAALQAPVIMMSQNRKEEKDRQRAQNDYLINLKAEIEIRNLHRKTDLLISEQMKSLFEIQKLQMDMMEEIRKRLDKKNGQ